MKVWIVQLQESNQVDLDDSSADKTNWRNLVDLVNQWIPEKLFLSITEDLKDESKEILKEKLLHIISELLEEKFNFCDNLEGWHFVLDRTVQYVLTVLPSQTASDHKKFDTIRSKVVEEMDDPEGFPYVPDIFNPHSSIFLKKNFEALKLFVLVLAGSTKGDEIRTNALFSFLTVDFEHYKEILSFLLNRNVDINMKYQKNMNEKKHEAPLFYAARDGLNEIVTLLLDNGANPFKSALEGSCRMHKNKDGSYGGRDTKRILIDHMCGSWGDQLFLEDKKRLYALIEKKEPVEKITPEVCPKYLHQFLTEKVKKSKKCSIQ